MSVRTRCALMSPATRRPRRPRGYGIRQRTRRCPSQGGRTAATAAAWVLCSATTGKTARRFIYPVTATPSRATTIGETRCPRRSGAPQSASSITLSRCMNSFTAATMPPRSPPELTCSGELWNRLLTQLRERGQHGERESGAFLLGQRPNQQAGISEFVLYDDLDPHSLDRGIVHFDGRYYGALWER